VSSIVLHLRICCQSSRFHWKVVMPKSCLAYQMRFMIYTPFHPSGEDMLVKLKYHDVPRLLENIKSYVSSHSYAESSATMTDDHFAELLDAILIPYLPKCCSELIFPSMTQYEFLRIVFGNLRDFHRLKVNDCVDSEFDESDVSRVNSKLDNLLVEVIPVELEHMVNAATPSASARSNIHVMIEFLLIILADVPKDIIRHDKLCVLLARVGALTKEVSFLFAI
ncbi:hypothetical protein HAX54_006305, partial [Datura stramonium]|nr:hypothetical protein [Datura stramonium]